MEAGFVVQIGQQGHHIDRVGHIRNYELESPLSSGLLEEVGQFLVGCWPVGRGKQG